MSGTWTRSGVEDGASTERRTDEASGWSVPAVERTGLRTAGDG